MLPEPADYPIVCEFPDIDPYKSGNCGVDWITTFDSGNSGPHVMISAVVHGNEPCGAFALDWLFRRNVRPLVGKLSLAFMNVQAYQSFNTSDPVASRYLDQDFNRVWQNEHLDANKTSRELERAREVRPFMDGVDFLLDIHSMQHKMAPLMLAGNLKKGRDLACVLGAPEWVVCDNGHAEGKRLRDYAGFSESNSNKTAILYEAGQHWEKDAGPRSIGICVDFLQTLGVVDPDFGIKNDITTEQSGSQQVVDIVCPVTVKSDKFEFADNFYGFEVLPKEGTLIAMDDELEIRTPHDDCVLIMPSRRLEPGKTAVRLGRFVT